MFFSDSVEVAADLATAQRRLSEYLRDGALSAFATSSVQEAQTTVLPVGIGPFSKHIEVQSVQPYLRLETIVQPVRWVATAPLGNLFPTLDADIELASIDSGTRVTLTGSYRTPLGDFGAALDRTVLHAVAKATITGFVRRLASVIEGAVQAERRTEQDAS